MDGISDHLQRGGGGTVRRPRLHWPLSTIQFVLQGGTAGARGDDEGIFVGRGKERQPTSPSHAKEYASDIHPPEMCGCMPHTVERSPTRRSLTHMCDPYKSRPIRCQSGRARPAGRSNLHSSKTKAARGNGRDMKLE